MSAIQQMIMAAYGTAIWTPATLFAASEQGVWYDPSDFSTLFQDSAGTVPVTATGQVVGKMLDKSGRGNHATQATTAIKPTLEQDANGKYYLAFDGVDDYMGIAAASALAITGDALFVAGCYLSAAGNTLFTCQTAPGTGNAYEVRVLNVGAGSASLQFIQASAATVETLGFGLTYNKQAAPTIARFYRASGNVVYKPDQLTPVTTATTLTPTAGGSPVFSLGRRQDGYGPLSGRIYQLIIRGAPTDAAGISAAETFVNSKTAAY